MKGDEFWDYDQQVDMEGFTSTDFFSILGKQSRDVTAAISRQKDQVSESIVTLLLKILLSFDSKKSLFKASNISFCVCQYFFLF